MRLRRILLLAGLLLAAAAIAGVAQPRLGRSAAPATGKTITVSGHGTVATVPDRASFGFTVDTRAQTASAALARVADMAAAVAAAVKNAGVAPADLQTSQVSLSPQTNQSGTDVIGYTASISITADTTIARAGAVVDAAVGAGATGVSGPNLSLSADDALYREALKNAVADAADKAKALAAAAGLTIDGAQSVVEGAAQVPVPLPAKAASAEVPIEPGTQEVAADVTVTYSVH
jgi:uncharacterized protein YggE